MRRVWMVAVAMLLGSNLGAQSTNGRGLPFATPSTLAEHIKALEENDVVTDKGGTLYADCSELARAALPRFRLSLNCDGLANFYRTQTTVRRCPQGVEARMDWVSGGKVVLDGDGEVRTFASDEDCLYWDDRLITSTKCWNFVREVIQVARRSEPSTQVMVPSPSPAPPPATRDTVWVRQTPQQQPPVVLQWPGPAPQPQATPILPTAESWYTVKGWPLGHKTTLFAVAGAACGVAKLVFDKPCLRIRQYYEEK